MPHDMEPGPSAVGRPTDMSAAAPGRGSQGVQAQDIPRDPVLLRKTQADLLSANPPEKFEGIVTHLKGFQTLKLWEIVHPAPIESLWSRMLD
jgi:hypothetical protein